jgi:TonB-dependent receptor
MKNTIKYRIYLIIILLLNLSVLFAQTGITGKVVDKKDKEPLTGAAILIEGTTTGTTVDIDGNYKLTGVSSGKYTLVISYVSYKSQRIQNVVVVKGKLTNLDIEMEDAALQLESVQVVAQRKTDTELSMLKSVRSAVQVVNGISSQQIGKTLDRDASEVVKRIPGVTIQDNRFIVVRGLNQRYNNVWLNNAATPSSETDVKAFSFDAIPSNMIDNLLIFKTGSPEFSAEATGGFIKISTKNIPDDNFLNAEYGIGYNNQATFRDTYRLPGTAFDFLGLGSGVRSIPSDFPANLSYTTLEIRDADALRLRNNWVAQRHTAFPNQKLSFAFGKKWNLNGGAKIGTVTSFNYSNTYNTRSNMENYAYERFDPTTETPTYHYKYNADIYSDEFKIGLLHNWAYQTTNGTRLEFKNILNQIGVDKTANTWGWNNYRLGNFKYFSNQYSSRTTYSGQFSGNHKLNEKTDEKLDWNVGFAYANRIEPDRQNWSMKENSDGVYEYVLPTVPSINELGRLYLTNHEYVGTLAANYERKVEMGSILTTVKTGEYTEYKTRNYSERSVDYRATNSGMFSNDVINALPFETLFTEPYLGQNKVLTLDEQTNITNSYNAQNLLAAGYLAINLPVGKLNIYGGVRAEYNLLTLNGYLDPNSPLHLNKPSINFFPSINTTYNITEKSLIRLAYAHTINRPEFREVSPMGYYDFTEKTSVSGNPNLKDASIQNVDLRFENYPSPTETFSIAAFYKHFTNPIEMVNVGGGLDPAYSFDNAMGATNYGLELEVKKSLETLFGLKNFSLSLNASYIYSQVQFANTLTERNRPLQGQSPVVVNAALFYQNDKIGVSSSLMYNVIGKRILVAAQLNQAQVVVPDIYEMPRHVIDFSLNKKISKKWDLKFGIKDLLAQNYVTEQIYEFVKDGVSKSAVLTNKVYNLGRTIYLGASWKF